MYIIDDDDEGEGTLGACVVLFVIYELFTISQPARQLADSENVSAEMSQFMMIISLSAQGGSSQFMTGLPGKVVLIFIWLVYSKFSASLVALGQFLMTPY